jgi:hypothetical protein
MMRRTLITAAVFACALGSGQAQETTLRVGSARAISTGATLIAIERGYSKSSVSSSSLKTSTRPPT